jgi:hypothetical protein
MKPVQVYDVNGVPCIAYREETWEPVARNVLGFIDFLCLAYLWGVAICVAFVVFVMVFFG